MAKDAKPSESEEYFEMTLTEVTYSFGVEEALVEEMVEEGIIIPLKEPTKQWYFDSDSVRLIKTVLRLQRELGINTAGAALAIELMEEIEQLRRHTG